MTRPSSLSAHDTAPRSRDVIIAALAGFGAFAVMLAVLFLRRKQLLSSDWMLQDNAWPLLAADAVRQGKRLFLDIQWNYGAMPVWFYVFVGFLFGQGPFGFYVGNALLLSVGFAFTAFTLRPCADRRVFLGLMCFLIMLVSVVTKGLNTGGFEFVAITGAMLVLTLDLRSEVVRWCLLGIIAGGLQWVKFGSGVLLVTALLLSILPDAFRGGGMRSVVRRVLVCASTLVACELVRVAYYYASLPPDYARNVVVPLYYIAWYKSYIIPEIRYPAWSNLAFFLTVQLPIIAPMIFCVVAVWKARWTEGGMERDGRKRLSICLLPAICYALGCAGYFRHVYHFYQYALYLGVPLAFFVVAPGWLGRAAMLTLMPLGAHVVYDLGRYLRSNHNLTNIAMVHGALWVPPAEAQSITDLQKAIAREGLSGSSLLVLPRGIAAYYFLGVQPVGRQVWLLQPLIQPYEYQRFYDALSSSRGVLVFSERDVSSLDREGARRHVLKALEFLGQPAIERLSRQLRDPVTMTARCIWIPIGDAAAGAVSRQ